MGWFDEKRGSRSRGAFLLAWLCVLLVVLCGTLQTVHTHPNGAAFHAASTMRSETAPAARSDTVPGPRVR